MRTKVSIAMCVVSIFAMALAYGQSDVSLGRVDIPFKFMAGKKEMPAGKYEFVKQGLQPSLLLRSEKSGKATLVRIRERLAAAVNSSRDQKARVVFDTVGDQKFLSEFWPAGNEDGYLVGITKGEEKHEVVTAN